MADIKSSNVVDNCEEDILVVGLCQEQILLRFRNISGSRDKRSHVYNFREVHSGGDFLVKSVKSQISLDRKMQLQAAFAL